MGGSGIAAQLRQLVLTIKATQVQPQQVEASGGLGGAHGTHEGGLWGKRRLKGRPLTKNIGRKSLQGGKARTVLWLLGAPPRAVRPVMPIKSAKTVWAENQRPSRHWIKLTALLETLCLPVKSSVPTEFNTSCFHTAASSLLAQPRLPCSWLRGSLLKRLLRGA